MNKSNLLLIIALLLPNITLATTYEIHIRNTSAENVSFGYYKGINIPSVCKDGFCWEEVLIKFRPLNNAENITATTVILQTKHFNERPYFLMIGGLQIEFTSCELLMTEEQRYFYPPAGDVMNVTGTIGRSYCLNQLATTINIQ